MLSNNMLAEPKTKTLSAKTGLKRAVFAGFSAALVACSSSAMIADKAFAKDQIEVELQVFSGNLKLFEVKYDAGFDANKYSANLNLKPAGIAKWFVDSKIGMSVKGKIADNRLTASSFTLATKKKKKKKYFSVSWPSKALPVTKRIPELSQSKLSAIKAVLKPDYSDTLTTVLKIGFQASEAGCDGTKRIYSGAEVFDLKFKKLGTQTLNGDTAGVYRGKVLNCKMTYVPVAGLSDKKHKKLLKKPPVFNLWLAQINLSDGGNKLLLPVGATGKIKGRNVVAYAVKAKHNGRPLNKNSLKKAKRAKKAKSDK